MTSFYTADRFYCINEHFGRMRTARSIGSNCLSHKYAKWTAGVRCLVHVVAPIWPSVVIPRPATDRCVPIHGHYAHMIIYPRSNLSLLSESIFQTIPIYAVEHVEHNKSRRQHFPLPQPWMERRKEQRERERERERDYYSAEYCIVKKMLKTLLSDYGYIVILSTDHRNYNSAVLLGVCFNYS